MTRKEREMLQRKMDIVGAARELFLTKEYEKVTMEEIAKKAEFTRRTLYSYFKNKLDLLMLVVLYEFDKSEPVYLAAIDKAISTDEKLLAYASVYFNFFKKTPSYYRLIQIYDVAEHGDKKVLSTAVRNEMNNSDFSLEKTARDIIETGINDGTFDNTMDVDLATNFFLKSLFGIVHQYILHPRFPDSQFYQEIKYLMRGLGCNS